MATTLKHVAEKASVSIRTVTRALKNEPGGNLDTYRRVRKIAKDLGYVPNIAARNLKTQRTNMVGILTPEFVNPAIMQKKNALQQLFEREGTYLVSGSLPTNIPALMDMLREWSGITSHVIVLSWREPLKDVQELEGLPMSFIFVDCGYSQDRFDRIGVDRGAGILAAVEHLFERGYRRIIRCGPDMSNRRKGFELAFEQAGLADAQAITVKTRSQDRQSGYEIGEQLLGAQPDAVFFETDQLAFGFYHYARENGISIPDDIAVVGFNDEPASLCVTPTLSSVRHPNDEITQSVHRLVREHSSTPRQLLHPTCFIARESS